MKGFTAFIVIVALSLPFFADAAPFGGRISQIIPCYNNAIYANVGAPRGGQYIWTPATQTYRFGPPSHAGQYILGLSGIPYYCLVSIVPIDTLPGISIMMMGSSGPAAPVVAPQTQSQSQQNTSIDLDQYCKTRTTAPSSGSNDPCDPLTQNLSCEQISSQGYKLIQRCQ